MSLARHPQFNLSGRTYENLLQSFDSGVSFFGFDVVQCLCDRERIPTLTTADLNPPVAFNDCVYYAHSRVKLGGFTAKDCTQLCLQTLTVGRCSYPQLAVRAMNSALFRVWFLVIHQRAFRVQ